MRAWLLMFVLLAGCGGVPTEPAAVVSAALDAARKGDLKGVLQCYTPDAARDVQRAVAAAEGSGWVSDAPLRLLSPGEVEEVQRDGDRAVVEIRGREVITRVCLTAGDEGWRITLDEAVPEGEAWACRPRETGLETGQGEEL